MQKFYEKHFYPETIKQDKYNETDSINTTNLMDSSQATESIVDLDIGELFEYPAHPFQPYPAEELNKLAESIKESGLYHPIIVQKKDGANGYYILSGHNRTAACKLLGHSTIKALVKTGLKKEEADFIVAESNLRQREHLLPSEKAKVYKMLVDALKKQGKRTDLYGENIDEINVSETSYRVGTKLDTGNKIAQSNNQSRSNLYRIIRLNNLVPELLSSVDSGKLDLSSEVEISYLKKQEQLTIYNYFFHERKSKIKLIDAVALRELSKSGEVNSDSIKVLMDNQHKKNAFQSVIKISIDRFDNLLDEIEDADRIDYIIEAVKFFKEEHRKHDAV